MFPLFRLTFFLTCSIFGLLGCHAFNCTIPNVGPGYCIPLNKCKSHHYESLKNGRGPYSSSNPIKGVCGFENGKPKVCCKSLKKLSCKKHFNAKLLPKLDECIVDVNDRIVNGKIANLGQFPWMSLIHFKHIAYKKYARKSFKCGGSIINSRYILTAAHCFDNSEFKAYSVRVGEHNFLTNPDCQKILPNKVICAPEHQDIEIEEIIKHPIYTNKPFVLNDIALIRLKTPIKFDSAYVRSICLPLTKDLLKFNLINEIVSLAGWGRTEEKKLSNVLRFMEAKAVDLEKCSLAYEDTSITSKQICVESNITDTCIYDSGGPLFYNHFIDDDYVTVLHGVISYGPTKCGDGSSPSVNTNVANHILWILNHLRP